MKTTFEILEAAKSVSKEAPLSTNEKNKALIAMSEAIIKNKESILNENLRDIDNAKGKISEVMIDRLKLTGERIDSMAKGINDLISLPDPVGRIIESNNAENGLVIKKVSVPFGVVAIIYESRPNVTSDAAALSFKSGNVCVLRSGKEAFFSASAIVKALKQGLASCGINENYVNLVEDTTRNSANELMTAVGYVDLLIPRGGKGLIKACVDNATVPCIETGTGICHIFVDKTADFKKAIDIVNNAKRSRPSVCNAAEVCLVHKDIAESFLPLLYESFCDSSRYPETKIIGDRDVCRIIPVDPSDELSFDTEYLDYKMAVGIVDSVSEAVEHIGNHSTHHSDCIISADSSSIDYFVSRVDSAAVYVNASTRFTDGGEFGLGCEMGISTQKLHARGPMGLNELNTYKYVVTGNGQTR